MKTTTDNDRYLRLSELADYSSLSVRTLMRFITDKGHPLPAHRAGRTYLVKKSDFDSWLDERRDLSAPRTVVRTGLTAAERAAYAMRGYTVIDHDNDKTTKD